MHGLEKTLDWAVGDCWRLLAEDRWCRYDCVCRKNNVRPGLVTRGLCEMGDGSGHIR